MSAPSNQQLTRLIRSMIVERQRLLIREANYLRGLVGLPPVKADSVGTADQRRDQDESRLTPGDHR